MILVISDIANDAAVTLVEMFPPGAASLITASQFHQTFKGGISVNNFASSKITINNTPVSIADITGVITTISNFYPLEFYYVETADREYVCAEMNAFFTYFLTELNCKKINPPSVRSFAGVGGYITSWIKTAQALNIPVYPVHIVNAKMVDVDYSGTIQWCTAIGDEIIGANPGNTLCRYTQDLKRALSLSYLSCIFVSHDDEYYLADIQTIPDVSTTANREAIVNYFS